MGTNLQVVFPSWFHWRCDFLPFLHLCGILMSFAEPVTRAWREPCAIKDKTLLHLDIFAVVVSQQQHKLCEFGSPQTEICSCFQLVYLTFRDPYSKPVVWNQYFNMLRYCGYGSITLIFGGIIAKVFSSVSRKKNCNLENLNALQNPAMLRWLLMLWM